MCVSHATPQWDFASRYSSWPKLLRITAYLYRFLRRVDSDFLNTRERILHLCSQKKVRTQLKTMQSDMFANEIATLKQRRLIPKSSALSVLNSYIDEDGLIRIRGRLRRACLPEATKNPIVLQVHPLLILIIQHHPLRTLHAGSQLTLASLRQEF